MKCLQAPFLSGNSRKHNRVLHIQHPTGSTGFYGISWICTNGIRTIDLLFPFRCEQHSLPEYSLCSRYAQPSYLGCGENAFIVGNT